MALSALYNTKITCPVCDNQFEATNVRVNSYRVASKDTDFFVYYEGVNPIFYEVYVCEHCGYAAHYKKFPEIASNAKSIILESLSSKWSKKSYAGERTVDNAIDSFKLALYNLQLMKAKSSDIAKICLRIAWMYRLKKEADRERDFLEFALNYYNDAYQREEFPIEKMDEYTCLYLIAELNRRVGKHEEATKWFGKLMGSPEARKNPELMELARDQYQLVKEAAGKKK